MSSRTYKSLFVFSLAFFLVACNASRYVKPLAKKEKAINASFGGPMILFGNLPIPIPLTTAGFGYGLSNKITAFGNLHTTSLMFANFQTDAGLVFGIYEKEKIFGISATAALQSAFHVRNMTGFRVWPSAELNAYAHFKKSPSFMYAGLGSWIELSDKKAFDEVQDNHLVPDLHVGYMFCHKKWNHQLEAKFIQPGRNNYPGVAPYIGINKKGALGIYYTAYFKF